MRVNYKELAKKFESSGLTMKAFGEQEGMSNSMVSYYIRKARKESSMINGVGISPIEIIPNKSSKCIRINTASGLRIDIPI